jgi:N-acetylglucosaminyl-diphospho-decaprenol L-rhamnosyltransferase
LPDVTVAIVHTSRPDLTFGCLESLERDSGRSSSIEVVVLDNGSGDDIAESVSQRFSNVRVITQHARQGLGASRNVVIRDSESRHLLFLDDDTEVPSGTIDALVSYLDAHERVAIVGPLIRGFDGRRQGSAWRLMTVPVQLTWALTLGQLGAVVSHGTKPKRVGAVSSCAMLVRREALEQIGLFDETYFLYSEEPDLAQRLERIGLERHYVPTVHVLHHGQGATGHMRERSINEFWRSMDLYLARHHTVLSASVLRWLTGFGYALAVVADAVGRRLPGRVRPAAANSWNSAIYRLHVRNAFRGNRDPGLREAAEDWNRRQDAPGLD